ncbi:MAG: glycosyltransferase [Ruminococcaceae bacterium]|nr:glycosyltransferase [Oscillospiraceae bacterium]
MSDENVVSVAIACYRNYEHLFEAINSVLIQDYPYIELIVSDDGSADFPKEIFEAYISENKSDNIVNTVVRTETKNVGTVKHFNHLIDCCSGHYLVFLAADDCLYDSGVISKYVEGIQTAGEDALIVMAQTGMYDVTMTDLDYYFLRPHVRSLLEQKKSKELYESLLLYPFLPTTSTFFKREFFDVLGKFDENYLLIEDVPLHFEITKHGLPIHYENFVATKHRHGGISHGQKKTLSKSKANYLRDCVNISKDKMAEAKHLSLEIPKSLREKAYIENCWREHSLAFEIENAKLSHKIIAILKHPYYIIVNRWLRSRSVSFNRLFKLFFTVGLALVIGANLLASSFDPVFMPVLLLLNKLSIGICLLAGILYIVFLICKIFESISNFDDTRLDF